MKKCSINDEKTTQNNKKKRPINNERATYNDEKMTHKRWKNRLINDEKTNMINDCIGIVIPIFIIKILQSLMRANFEIITVLKS